MASKNQIHLQLHLPEDLARQLVCLSEAEGRTVNNQILLLVRNSIAYHERAKGKLSPEKLRGVDFDRVEEYLKNDQ